MTDSDETPPALPLGRIAELIGAELVGDPAYIVRRPLPGGAPAGEGDVVIALGEDPGPALAGSGARAALIAATAKRPQGLAGLLLAERPRLAMARLLNLFEQQPAVAAGIHPTAVVDPSAEIGHGVRLGPFVVVGAGVRIGRNSRLLAQVTVSRGAAIGADCLLHPGVRVGERVRLGDRVIIHANTVLGSDGFGFVTPQPSTVELALAMDSDVKTRNEPVERIASLGTVIVEDDVEIGACCTIDRSTLGATRIGKRTKIDNQVQIAHNVRVGEDSLLCGQVGLSGSTVVGDRVVVGGGAGVADGVKIGDDALIGAGSGVIKNVPPGEIQLGSPGIRKDEKVSEFLNLRRLPRFFRDVLDLRRRLEFLERAAQSAGARGSKHD